eukprot:1467679-Pleurochrysis_carterae.AAC.1
MSEDLDALLSNADVSYPERLCLAASENHRLGYEWIMYAIHIAHSNSGDVEFARVLAEASHQTERKTRGDELRQLPIPSVYH